MVVENSRSIAVPNQAMPYKYQPSSTRVLDAHCALHTRCNCRPTPSLNKNHLLAELLRLYPHLQLPNDPKSTPSPTDSHAHRRPHSQHSRRSRDSISSILLVTTERLHSETARANAAEKQITDVMTLFRNTHDQKIKLERELLRVREELSLYKVQLEVAQKEIFRAQEIVERIDRQRVDAEESAVRAREKSRKLVEARAVDLALEEGRRLGFEEGLNQGRMLGQVETERHQVHRNRNESSGSSETARSRKSRSTARSKRRPAPETATPRSASSRPEEITIQDAAVPPRPMSAHKQSPAAPRRSVVLPPDNYIPILNPDATITLPPPHELAMHILPDPGPSSAVLQRDQGDRAHPYIEQSAKGKSASNASYGRMTPPSPTPRREPPDPERLIPMAASESHEPRSPALYPSRPPLRRREVVMPIPLGNQLLGGKTTSSAASLRQGSEQSLLTPKQPTPLRAIRTESNASVPVIEVETPSTISPASERTTYDRVLLTPDRVNKPVALPSQPHDVHLSTVPSSFDPNAKDTITAVLPDNNLPPGFIPLSPIPGMANLNPYPPGFAPSLQAAEQPTPKGPDFVYPASPLARPQ